MGSFFCLFYLLTNADFYDKMGGPPAYAAVRIFHYTTPRQFCQEKSCTKVKKIFSRNLVILSIVIRGQSAIIDNVRREQWIAERLRWWVWQLGNWPVFKEIWNSLLTSSAKSAIMNNVKRGTPEPQVGVGLRLEVAIDRSPITLRSLRSGTHGIKEKIHEFFLENLLTNPSECATIENVERE